MLDAFLGQCLHDFVADTEVGKGGFGCGSLGVMSGVMRDARMPFGFVFDCVNRCGHARTS